MNKIAFSKRELVKRGFSDRDLDRLMHSEEFHKVGFRTAGGHYRFVLEDLVEYLKTETMYRT